MSRFVTSLVMIRVEISPDATDVTYKSGVLWWSTGSQDEFVRHSLDLRTV